MRLNRHRLLEAIESGVKYALELDDKDYNNEETIDFNKDKFKSKTNQEIFQEKVQAAFDNKRFFLSVKDMISQFNITWKPKDKEDLKDTINAYCEYYNYCTLDLNFMDISDITDMSGLFEYSKFNGDISKWNVSNVTDMSYMFYGSKFNGDISRWNVSNVTDMSYMFAYSKFNGDISNWDVSSVKDMIYMFDNSEFSGDLSNWEINVESIDNIKYMLNSSSQNIIIDPLKIKLYRNLLSYKKIPSYTVQVFKSMYSDWDEKKLPVWLKKLERQIKKYLV